MIKQYTSVALVGIFGICAGILLLCSQCNYFTNPPPQQAPPPSFSEVIDTSCTIGFVALDIELFAGLKVADTAYDFLEEIVATAKRGIPQKTTYTQIEALAHLQYISKIITHHQKLNRTYHGAFSMCLQYRLFDCDINTLIYLTIAQELNLPLYAILMPSHIAIVWHNADADADVPQTIYWETTEGRTSSLQFYAQHYNIDSTQIGKNLMLKKLSKTELLAVIWFNIAQTYANNQQHEKAIVAAREAITIAPSWFKPYSLSASVYHQMQLPENTIYFAQQATQRLPQLPQTYALLGTAYTTLGCNTEAIAAYEQQLFYLPTSSFEYAETVARIKQQIEGLIFDF